MKKKSCYTVSRRKSAGQWPPFEKERKKVDLAVQDGENQVQVPRRCKLFSACLTPESFAVSRCSLSPVYFCHFVHDHRPLIYTHFLLKGPPPPSMGSYISISNQSHRTSGGGQCQAESHKEPKRLHTPWAWPWPLGTP
ncbi:hypothetical protein HZ326_1038 [Fusarium oxysporum f. sp. albedinis]|nr:hypothetical protein HZ326_1038 [Fusarium oxysporum f. sp. albedinis]